VPAGQLVIFSDVVGQITVDMALVGSI
jgi:hypothetical protein